MAKKPVRVEVPRHKGAKRRNIPTADLEPIMARRMGRTGVHDLAPEDIRAIAIATAVNAGVPLAGTETILEAAA